MFHPVSKEKKQGKRPALIISGTTKQSTTPTTFRSRGETKAAPQLATEGSYKSPKRRWRLIYGPHEQRAKGSIRLGKNHALGRGATGDHAQTRFD